MGGFGKLPPGGMGDRQKSRNDVHGTAPRRQSAAPHLKRKFFYRLVYRPSVGTSCTYRSSFLHFYDLFRRRIILFWDSGRFCREGRPPRCGKVP